jgi:hypothetical protein
MVSSPAAIHRIVVAGRLTRLSGRVQTEEARRCRRLRSPRLARSKVEIGVSFGGLRSWDCGSEGPSSRFPREA